MNRMADGSSKWSSDAFHDFIIHSFPLKTSFRAKGTWLMICKNLTLDTSLSCVTCRNIWTGNLFLQEKPSGLAQRAAAIDHNVVLVDWTHCQVVTTFLFGCKRIFAGSQLKYFILICGHLNWIFHLKSQRRLSIYALFEP